MSTSSVDLSTAIRVSSIKEEYVYLRRNPCFCGGAYRPTMQSLVNGENGTHYDVIGAQCMSCKRERAFVFDINSFYGKK